MRSSPNGLLDFKVRVTGDTAWWYGIGFQGISLVGGGRLGLVIDDRRVIPTGPPSISEEPFVEEFPVMGNRSVASVRGSRWQYDYPAGLDSISLEVVVTDEAVAFRYHFTGADAGAVYVLSQELTAFTLGQYLDIWSAPDYEGLWSKQTTEEFQDSVPVVLPLVVAVDSVAYLTFTEAKALDYPAVSVQSTGYRRFGLTFQRTPTYQGSYRFTGKLVTPWRVFMVNEDLQGIVNNPTVYALNDPPGPELATADWIEPGRSGWTWISHGYRGQNFANIQTQLRAVGELGWEYLIVDDGWEHWPDKWERVKELVELGDSVGVKILLWKPTADYQAAWQVAKFGWQDTIRGLLDPAARTDFLDRAQAAGVAGLKVDFVNEHNVERVNFVRTILEETAARRMVVNFHGASKPSGLERTYPNLLVYESVRGMEGTRGIEDFYHYSTVLPSTRYVIGSGDYTPVPGHAGRWGSRAHQLANAVNLLAPLNSFAVAPAKLLELPEREFLESLPTTWDETVVLPPSAIGRVAVIAKRKGADWYLGVAAGREAQYIELALAQFLPPGTYEALIYRDGRENRTELHRETRRLKATDTLKVYAWTGGGMAVRFRPVE